jgi:hypothetical protein
MKDKSNLIDNYVNLYRQLWLSNDGLWTEDLRRMSESDLKKEISNMKYELKRKNTYYPGIHKMVYEKFIN